MTELDPRYARTLVAWLAENGLEDAGRYQCRACARTRPTWCFRSVEGREEWDGGTELRPSSIEGDPPVEHTRPGPLLFVCDACESEADRKLVEAAESIAREYLPPADSWEGVDGDQVRRDRNLALERSRWTVDVDSPLTAASREAWLGYRRALNRLTLDYPRPSAVVWPEPPGVEYEA